MKIDAFTFWIGLSIIVSLLIPNFVMFVGLDKQVLDLENRFRGYSGICTKTEIIVEEVLINTRINASCMEEATLEYFGCFKFRWGRSDENEWEISCPIDIIGQDENMSLATELRCLDLAHFENVTRTFCTEKSLVKGGSWEIEQ